MKKKNGSYQPARPVCIRCRIRTSEFEYINEDAVCIPCIAKEEKRKNKMNIVGRDSEYWDAYRKHLGVG